MATRAARWLISEPKSLSTECSGEASPAGELREAPVTHEPHGLGVDVEAGELVAEASALADTAAVRPALACQREQAREHGVQLRRARQPHHAALVGQRACRDRPALVQLPDQVIAWHHDVVEEHLVEVHVIRSR